MFEGDDEPTIRLRFTGDGRETSKKIGTVMAVFSVLRERKHQPNYQYTACLYNGKFSHFLSGLTEELDILYLYALN